LKQNIVKTNLFLFIIRRLPLLFGCCQASMEIPTQQSTETSPKVHVHYATRAHKSAFGQGLKLGGKHTELATLCW